jgi:hypothetical protein
MLFVAPNSNPHHKKIKVLYQQVKIFVFMDCLDNRNPAERWGSLFYEND